MANWKIDKKISLTLIIATISYVIVGVGYAISFKMDMDNLRNIPERMAKIEQKTDDIKEMLNQLITRHYAEY